MISSLPPNRGEIRRCGVDLAGVESRVTDPRQLNDGVDQPGLAVILNGTPEVIAARLNARGGHSLFERQTGSSHAESRLCRDTSERLADRQVHHPRVPEGVGASGDRGYLTYPESTGLSLG